MDLNPCVWILLNEFKSITVTSINTETVAHNVDMKFIRMDHQYFLKL